MFAISPLASMQYHRYYHLVDLSNEQYSIRNAQAMFKNRIKAHLNPQSVGLQSFIPKGFVVCHLPIGQSIAFDLIQVAYHQAKLDRTPLHIRCLMQKN